MFDDVLMAKMASRPFGIGSIARQLPSAVVEKFKECLISGAATPEEDQKALSLY